MRTMGQGAHMPWSLLPTDFFLHCCNIPFTFNYSQKEMGVLSLYYFLKRKEKLDF
jgi:hypothetical protein